MFTFVFFDKLLKPSLKSEVKTRKPHAARPLWRTPVGRGRERREVALGDTAPAEAGRPAWPRTAHAQEARLQTCVVCTGSAVTSTAAAGLSHFPDVDYSNR